MIEPKDRAAWLKMMEAKARMSVAWARVFPSAATAPLLTETFTALLAELREAWEREKEKP